MNNNIIEMRGITKRFPGIVALDEVDFVVEKGEVHGLVGENGAGKSTLLKILAGLYKNDSGSITIDNEAVEDLDVSGAIRHGIRMLAQNPEIFPTLSIAENIFIEDMPLKGGFLDKTKLYKLTLQALERIDIKLDPKERMETLTFLQQKIVLLAKALWYGVKILILDEPTAALTSHEIALLFKHVQELNKMGTTVIYVSHYLEEVFDICDAVTILREGKKVVTEHACNMDINTLVRYMIGKDVNLFPQLDHKPGKVVLEVKNLSKKNKYSDVSFNIREGEIVSFAGIKGSGKEDVIDGLFGFQPTDKGDIYIDGEKLFRVTSEVAFSKGVLLLPADRLLFGLFLNQSVAKNVSICSLGKIQNHFGFFSSSLEKKLAEEYKNLLSIRASSLDLEVQFLSGGNQQKVVLSKVLAANPKVLVLHEPTAGIDIGSKAEIHTIIEQLARRGIGIVLLTYDITEILNMCDRIYVLYKGVITKEINRDDKEFTKKNLMLWMEGSGNGNRAN